jgi:hypothetical protein
VGKHWNWIAWSTLTLAVDGGREAFVCWVAHERPWELQDASSERSTCP